MYEEKILFWRLHAGMVYSLIKSFIWYFQPSSDNLGYSMSVIAVQSWEGTLLLTDSPE